MPTIIDHLNHLRAQQRKAHELIQLTQAQCDAAERQLQECERELDNLAASIGLIPPGVDHRGEEKATFTPRDLYDRGGRALRAPTGEIEGIPFQDAP